MQCRKARSLFSKGPGDLTAEPGIVRVQQGHDLQEVDFPIQIRCINLLGVKHDDLTAQLGDDVGVGILQQFSIFGCIDTIRIEPQRLVNAATYHVVVWGAAVLDTAEILFQYRNGQTGVPKYVDPPVPAGQHITVCRYKIANAGQRC